MAKAGKVQKFKAAKGRMPTLQFCRPSELRIDPAYQRDVSNGASQTLIRRIAENWNWDLCQPLVVARRVDLTERLFVIDGQHRLEAARVRGDIDQLPCVIVSYGSAADEAANFVALNQVRRPLSGLDLFKAAIASGDEEACAIMAAMEAAGLSLAPHINWISWKPGMVSQVGAVRQAWRKHGPAATSEALQVLATAWAGKVLAYAGTVFPGLAASCAVRIRDDGKLPEGWFATFTGKLGAKSQDWWRDECLRVRGEFPALTPAGAAELAVERVAEAIDGKLAQEPPASSKPSWAAQTSTPVPPAMPVTVSTGGKRWCDQCDMQVTDAQATGCKSRFCSLRKVA